MPISRDKILLESTNKLHHIIEIGPSHRPLTPKSAGWNSKSIDHDSKDGLIKKYRDAPGVDVSRIEEVDFIWQSGPLSDAIPAALHGTFDRFISSHVIEHMPDLIGFLESANTLLTPNGIVALIIPDKRFCFDYFRPLTGTWDIIAAHTEHRSRHTPKDIFEHCASKVTHDDQIAWGQHPVPYEKFALINTLEEAYQIALNIQTNPNADYYDIHTWKFTPASFTLRLLELARLKLTDWQIDRIIPTIGCEFFVWLKRGGIEAAHRFSAAAFQAEQLSLLNKILLEEKEQIDFLIADPVKFAKANLPWKEKPLFRYLHQFLIKIGVKKLVISIRQRFRPTEKTSIHP